MRERAQAAAQSLSLRLPGFVRAAFWAAFTCRHSRSASSHASQSASVMAHPSPLDGRVGHGRRAKRRPSQQRPLGRRRPPARPRRSTPRPATSRRGAGGRGTHRPRGNRGSCTDRSGGTRLAVHFAAASVRQPIPLRGRCARRSPAVKPQPPSNPGGHADRERTTAAVAAGRRQVVAGRRAGTARR
jgi:hypothetical protein